MIVGVRVLTDIKVTSLRLARGIVDMSTESPVLSVVIVAPASANMKFVPKPLPSKLLPWFRYTFHSRFSQLATPASPMISRLIAVRSNPLPPEAYGLLDELEWLPDDDELRLLDELLETGMV